MKNINKYLIPYRLFRPEIVKDFITFLKGHHALAKFDKNLHDQLIIPLNLLGNPRHLINQAFEWSETKEGHFYWKSLHIEWYEMYNKKYENDTFIDKTIKNEFIGLKIFI